MELLHQYDHRTTISEIPKSFKSAIQTKKDNIMDSKTATLHSVQKIIPFIVPKIIKISDSDKKEV